MSRFKALSGVTYRIDMPSSLEELRRFEKTGSKAASVFPLPVGAIRRTFSPRRIRGIAFFCGSVGSENPRSASAERICLARSENVVFSNRNLPYLFGSNNY